MKLHSAALSGHAHRARLFLSLIDAPHEIVEVDLRAGAHKSPDFLKLNAFGQVPVLEDGDVIVPDSNAIMVYVARKLGRTDWLPDDAAGEAAVQRWLSVAAGQIFNGPCTARLITLFGLKADAELAISKSHAILTLMDEHLETRDWFTADRPTIADVALYSYVAAAPEGNVDLSAYGRIAAWLARVEALPGFVAIPKSAVGLAA